MEILFNISIPVGIVTPSHQYCFYSWRGRTLKPKKPKSHYQPKASVWTLPQEPMSSTSFINDDIAKYTSDLSLIVGRWVESFRIRYIYMCLYIYVLYAVYILYIFIYIIYIYIYFLKILRTRRGDYT